MQFPTPAAAAGDAAAARAGALALLRTLQSKLPGSEEMAGKLQLLQEALQQVRCTWQAYECTLTCSPAAF